MDAFVISSLPPRLLEPLQNRSVDSGDPRSCGPGSTEAHSGSPLLSNLYLTEVDRMLEKAIATTRREQYTNVQYARFADDLVILIHAHPRHDWLVTAVERRLREELAKLRVEINEDKSRMVDLAKGESFSFLGFEYRRIRSRNRVWRPYYAPKLKKRTALFTKLREIFQRNVSQPVGKVIEQINPILRGWVNYFQIGDSSRCLSMVKRWVEKKVRRHLMRARGRQGFGLETVEYGMAAYRARAV
jgi:RNA-directed DNA polymerase